MILLSVPIYLGQIRFCVHQSLKYLDVPFFPIKRLLEKMVTDFLGKDWGIVTYPLVMIEQGTSFRGPGFSFSQRIPGLKTASSLTVGKKL